MKSRFVQFAIVVGALLGGVGLAAPSASADTPLENNYYGRWVASSGAVLATAHLQRISGDHWNIAIADQIADNRNACVKIAAKVGSGVTYINYCDQTGSADGIASHYDIYYSWSEAYICSANDCLEFVGI